MSRVWSAQLLMTAFIALGFFLIRDAAHAAASALGGLTAIVNTWVLARSVQQASQQTLVAPGNGMGSILGGLVLRIAILTVVLLGATRGLGLPALPIILGFVLVLLGAILVKRLPGVKDA